MSVGAAAATCGPEGESAKAKNHISRDGRWETLRRPKNLVRYIPSGVFFGRLKYKGKPIGPKTLDTDDYKTAVARLPGCIAGWKKEVDDRAKGIDAKAKAPTTWAEARAMFERESQALFDLGSIQAGALKYRLGTAAKLAWFWPSMVSQPANQITSDDALLFMAEAHSGKGRFAGHERPLGVGGSPKGVFYGGPQKGTSFVRLLWTAGEILDRAIKMDVKKGLPPFENPFDAVPRVAVPPSLPPLPSEPQFNQILSHIRKVPCKGSTEVMRFRAWAGVHFLAMSGLRIGELIGEWEATHEEDEPYPGLLWEDVRDDLRQPYFHVICEKKRKGEKWRRRRKVPFYGGADGAMMALVRELRQKWYAGNPKAKVFEGVSYCYGFNYYLEHACRKIPVRDASGNLIIITQHDLRHIFATRCVEAGVTWKALAEWLGHEDGGLLAARTYSCLREEHSFEMAERLGK